MGDDAAVRAATAEDRAAVSGAVAASGLLAGHDLDEVMATFEAGGLWLIHPDPVGAGVAYAAEEPLTDRTWNLLMLVVHPARQGQGVGRALVRAAERAVRQRGGRLLQVDTSRVAGLPGNARSTGNSVTSSRVVFGTTTRPARRAAFQTFLPRRRGELSSHSWRTTGPMDRGAFGPRARASGDGRVVRARGHL